MRSDLAALPRPAWTLFAGMFVNRFGSFVVPFLVLYLVHRGYSPAVAGTVAGAYGLGNLGASVLGGTMADRLGRRITIIVSMTSSGAAMLILSQVTGVALLAIVTLVAGLTSELYRPASSALLTDLVLPSGRVTAYAAYRLAINLGMAAGPAAAGWLADRSFSLLFVGDAFTSFLCAAIIFLVLPADRGHPRATDSRSGGFGFVVRDHRLMLLLLAYLAAALAYFQMYTTLPLHVHAVGLPSAGYGALISLNAVVVLILELPLSSVTRRLPPGPVVALGLLLIGLGFAITGPAHSVPLLALSVCIWTIGEIVHSPVSQAYVGTIAPPHLRGRYQGAFGTTWGLALVLAPVLGTRLFAWNEAALWIGCGALGLGAAGLALFAVRIPEA